MKQIMQATIDALIASELCARENVAITANLHDEQLHKDAIDNHMEHRLMLIALHQRHPEMDWSEWDGCS